MSLELFRSAGDTRRLSRPTPLVAWPFSIAAHAVVLAALLVIPLMAADVLPTPRDLVDFVQAVPVPEPPAPPVPVTRVPAAIQAMADQRLAPVVAPPTIGDESGLSRPLDTAFAQPGRADAWVPAGGGLEAPILGERPPVAAPRTPERPGRRFQPPEKIYDVKPEYPEMALRVQIEGTVIIEAIIGPTGAVEQATVLRSVPLLDAAALAAVRQWRYTPTLLNGEPIAVIMTVTVHFKLTRNP